MKLWLQKLNPKTTSVTESRIYHRVNVIFESCSKLPQDEAILLLQEEYDFQALASPLAELNLNRLHLTNNEVYTQPPSEDIRNNVIVALEHLRAQERESVSFVLKWVRRLCFASQNLTESQLKNRIKTTLQKYRQFPQYKKIRIKWLFKYVFHWNKPRQNRYFYS